MRERREAALRSVVTGTTSFLWRAEPAGALRNTALWRKVHDHALRLA